MVIDIGNKIKKARLLKKFTHKTIALNVGLCATTIRNFESGKSFPGRVTAKEIATLLDMNIKELIDYAIYHETHPAAEHFRMSSKGLRKLRDLHIGTLFFFNNKNITEKLCIKTGIKDPEGTPHKFIIGGGWDYYTPGYRGGYMMCRYLASARVISLYNYHAVLRGNVNRF